MFLQAGTYFGRKTAQAVNVERFLKLFELIEHSSHTVAMEDERIILASDSIKLAA